MEIAYDEIRYEKYGKYDFMLHRLRFVIQAERVESSISCIQV